MAKPKFNINDLIQGAGGVPPDIGGMAPDLGGAAPIAGPSIGAPLGAAALPPTSGLPPLPLARPKKSKGGGKKGKKSKGGGY